MATGFEGFGLCERSLDAIHSLGWREPTPIQAAVLPHLLQGRDVLGQAATGSGKTGAFGLALAERVRGPGIEALVVVPTRELCLQVARDLDALSHGGPLKAAAIYGGVPFEPQLAQLADPSITCVVATPGRLIEFIRMGRAKLGRVHHTVIDEADRMLDLGFLPDVESILRDLPQRGQVSLFSATFPKRVLAIARRYMPTARTIAPGGPAELPETGDHVRVEVASSVKREALLALLAQEAPTSCLIFVRKKTAADELAPWLTRGGAAARAIHGDLPQSAREKALAAFRTGEAKILVATDVAARGLDIPAVTHVINFEMPEDSDAYVHRAGRTARAGRKGRIITITSEQDRDAFTQMIARLPIRVERLRITGFEAPAAAAGSAERRASIPPPKRMDKKRLKPGWIDRKRH
ncbi:MAG: DEAD/DEAH box helicase [Thermoplasmatota archaeon]